MSIYKISLINALVILLYLPSIILAAPNQPQKPHILVDLSANSQVIEFGESTTLNWTTSKAKNVLIEPGIGDVEKNGSLSISPSSSTTYTLTATKGKKNEASAQVHITVLPVINSYSVSPSLVVWGESATLSWISEGAEQVIIDNDVGSVPLNGSIDVTPTETTLYTITVWSGEESVKRSVTVTVVPMIVDVQHPENFQTIDSPTVLISGNVHTTAPHFKVKVNDHEAIEEGNSFYITDFPLIEGENNLSITVEDSFRKILEQSITVYRKPAAESNGWIGSLVEKEVGITPFATNFKVDLQSIEGIIPDSAMLSYEGSGNVAINQISTTEYALYFETPGLYTFKYRISNLSNNEFEKEVIFKAIDSNVYRETLEECKDFIQILGDQFNELITSYPINIARQKVAEMALENPDITQVIPSSNGILIVYKNLHYINVSLEDPAAPSTEGSSSLSPQETTPQTEIPDSSLKYPANNKVLVYAPFAGDNSQMNWMADTANDYFNSTSPFFKVATEDLDLKKNSTASLDLVKSFGDYGTIIIHSHGWHLSHSSSIGPGFYSGTIEHEDIDRLYIDDMIRGIPKIVKDYPVNNPDTGIHYVVMPGFIDKYASSMEGAFVIFRFCGSFSIPNMWEAFKSKGAKVGLGFTDSYYGSFANGVFTPFLEAMVPGDFETQPLTVSEAFNSIPENLKISPAPAPESGGYAEFKLYTASPEWNNYIFSENCEDFDLSQFKKVEEYVGRPVELLHYIYEVTTPSGLKCDKPNGASRQIYYDCGIKYGSALRETTTCTATGSEVTTAGLGYRCNIETVPMCLRDTWWHDWNKYPPCPVDILELELPTDAMPTAYRCSNYSFMNLPRVVSDTFTDNCVPSGKCQYP